MKKTKLVMGMLLVMVLAMSTGLIGETIYVNYNTGDDNSGTPYKTFYAAYIQAVDNDILDLTGTFDWTNADETGDVAISGYTIDKNITIQGQGFGETFVQAASSANTADRRVFTVNNKNVTFKNMTIRYGKDDKGAGDYTKMCGGILGVALAELTIENCEISYNYSMNTSSSNHNMNSAGGILFDNSSLTMTNSTVKNNSIQSTLYGAGGLATHDAHSCEITNCTFDSNIGIQNDGSWSGAVAYHAIGGGLDLYNNDEFAIVTNCTFSDNTTNNAGGGIIIGNQGAYLTNCTIANNSAEDGGGGVLFDTSHDILYLKNCIIANNMVGTSTNDFHLTDAGDSNYIIDNECNLVEFSANYTWSGVGHITGDQANLNLSSTLADNDTQNGTQTLKIDDGSVAIDAGKSGKNHDLDVPITDQRGFQRGSSRDTYDIGAYENGATPLPVTLSSFTASFVNGSSLLNWTTQSESNNLGWNIYHSETENSDETILLNANIIDGAGTTSLPTDYSFDDEAEIVTGNSYWYWLESIEYDGTSLFYEPIKIDIPLDEDEQQPPELIVDFGLAQNYPNPFNPTTKIAFMLAEGNQHNIKIMIYNSKGQVVKIFDNLDVDNSGYGSIIWNGDDSNNNAVSSGIYLYKLITPSRE